MISQDTAKALHHQPVTVVTRLRFHRLEVRRVTVLEIDNDPFPVAVADEKVQRPPLTVDPQDTRIPVARSGVAYSLPNWRITVAMSK